MRHCRAPSITEHWVNYWAILLTPLCLSSLSCINKYLAIDSGGYVNEESLHHSNYNMAECFPEKLSWQQVCQRVKCKVPGAVPELFDLSHLI